MQIRPLPGQCLLEVLPHESQTHAGIFLPDIAHDRQQGEKEKPAFARVIAVGQWKRGNNGFAILPDFHAGQKVIVSFYAGTKLTRSLGERLRLCSLDDVLAVVYENETQTLPLSEVRSAV